MFENEKPIWGMSYSGGVIEETGIGNISSVYAFLRRALEKVCDDKPFRGPQNFQADGFVYRMKCEGGLERFSGKEEVFLSETLCYELHFSGGWIN
ncbi:MAG: DUF5680 domain-containing protein [Devosiaceae bacterium]|nr:DUF5680 domain-containing protein [Devosiaceae bacterium]